MQLICKICCKWICIEDEIGVTECGHLFHILCAVPNINENQKCPDCHQFCSSNLRKVFLVKLNTSVENLAISLDKTTIDVTNQKPNNFESINSKFEKYENKIIELKLINKTLEDNIKTITTERDELNEQIDEYRSNFESIDNIWTLKMELESLIIENENFKSELFSLEDTNRRLEYENNRTEDELSFELQELSNKVRNLEDENEHLKATILTLENLSYHQNY